MSVLSEILTTLTDSVNIESYEGTVDQVLKQSPKYSRFAAVVEEEAEYDQDGLDGLHGAEVTYTISIQTYVRQPSISDAWSEARDMRDTIVTMIKSNLFDGRPLMIQRWERTDRESEFLEAGYEITVEYQRIES